MEKAFVYAASIGPFLDVLCSGVVDAVNTARVGDLLLYPSPADLQAICFSTYEIFDENSLVHGSNHEASRTLC